MPVTVKMPKLDKIFEDMLDSAEDALIAHASEIQSFIRQNAPYGFGELRASFQVTDLTVSNDKLEVKVVSNSPYAKEMDEEERWHMPFRSDESGQRSFTELGQRGGGRIARYWSGFAAARSQDIAERYKSGYIEKSVEQAGGDDGLLKKLRAAIKRTLGA